MIYIQLNIKVVYAISCCASFEYDDLWSDMFPNSENALILFQTIIITETSRRSVICKMMK